MTRFGKFILIFSLGLGILLTGVLCYLEDSLGTSDFTAVTGPTAEAAEQKYTCGMHPMIIVDEPGTCPICGMALTPLKSDTGSGTGAPQGERKIKYWVAPMDPTYIRNEPGKSPMGMDLVPVYEDQAASGSLITIDPVTVQNMGVRTATVERRSLSRPIRTVGLVGYEEPRQYFINSKISGWVEKLHVAEMGQQVRKGEPLLEIYSPDLVAAQEEFLLALHNGTSLGNSPFPAIAEGARRLLEASRQRLRLWDISERQIAELERTQKVKKTLTLYAPDSGIVTQKMVTEGMYVKAGMDLLQISDISKVWVFADIYEYELPWVRVGQEALVEFPYRKGEVMTGTVSTIYPYVEAKTRTVKARIDLNNPELELKPDMYLNVRLKTEVVDNALAIPAEAVLRSGEKQTVFVALGQGKFEPRQIKTGLQSEEGYVEVLQGLLDGERVVTSAQFMLDSESKLREAIQKMLEPKTAPTSVEGGDASVDDLFQEDKPKENLNDLF